MRSDGDPGGLQRLEAGEFGTCPAQEEIEWRKRVEETLRQADKQRTELLGRERIARAETEEANRLKDEFLATLPHELRSPLNAIVAWSHTLGEPGLDPATASRAVQAIDRNARAQIQLVGDIGPVLGDASRLQQLTWNLLSNAIRFAPVGGRVQPRVQDAASCVELSATDDGPGIDPAFMPYVFDRFRQADSSSTRRHGGLGLGLAIVRHLVELHGGTVEARNREDRPGAVLTVRLPRPQGAAADGASAERGADANAREKRERPAASLQDVSVLSWTTRTTPARRWPSAWSSTVLG